MIYIQDRINIHNSYFVSNILVKTWNTLILVSVWLHIVLSRTCANSFVKKTADKLYKQFHAPINFKVQIGLTLHSSFCILIKTLYLQFPIKTSSLSFCIISVFYFFIMTFGKVPKQYSSWYIFQKNMLSV